MELIECDGCNYLVSRDGKLLCMDFTLDIPENTIYTPINEIKSCGYQPDKEN
jgi:hypothetical protein